MRHRFILLSLILGCTAVPAPPPAPVISPTQQANDQFAAEVMKKIAGRENEPAEKVFENIQILFGVPAGKFVTIMNYGYSHALGVQCTHCHDVKDFADDDKKPKRAAREMAVMHRTINDKLRTMSNLEDPPDDRAINCWTCHRGSIDPRVDR